MKCFVSKCLSVLFLTTIIISVLSRTTHAQEITVTNEQSPLGINFWFFTDYQRIWPFVDFFKTSRPFFAQPADGSYPWKLENVTLDLDEYGYPKSLPEGVGAATLLFWSDSGYHPEGNYTVLWDGDGDISVDNFGIGEEVSRETNKLICHVPAGPGVTEGVLLKITRTNPADPVRNIRFIAPGFEDVYKTQPFHPRFLELLKPFRVLRFMDWMHANRQHVGTWEARNTRQSQTYQMGDEGVPVEEMVQLCNTLHADPWFCLPANGDDNYYRKFAEFVRDSLDPSLRIYVEWANEVWNGMFYGGSCAEQLAAERGLGSGWDGRVKGWSSRMVELFEIFEEVFGDELEKRVIRVAATQMFNFGVSTGILDYNNAYEHCDILAGAPYFNRAGEYGSTDALIAGLNKSVDANVGRFPDFVALAQKYGLRPATYEGGMDLFDVADQILDVKRDPRIKDVYDKYFAAWKNAGGTMFVHYTFCDAVWGLIERMEQPVSEAYEYQAALEYVENNPRWWDEPERMPSTGITCPRVLRHAENLLRLDRTGLQLQAPGQRTSIHVLSVNGRQVKTARGTVNLDNVPSGMYFGHIAGSQKTPILKIAK